ncbi:tetratricopeptide repeat protein [Ruegeria atlantica]|uniref:tetratricopeptide repeat protein n=1 Tax=Ruegeria atlantica TaxID=81569 RepID=UPI00147FC50F|nr:tetratricopeptide repeat protein [Ruegeria atlantica]
MTADTPIDTPKRKVTFVRVAIVLVVLCIVALPILRKKHDALVDTCSSDKGDLQTTLDACDLLLDWTVFDPAERSLAYRNKMRLYMGQKDWEAAKREADLAIAADPESEVPLQWKAMIFIRNEDFPQALTVIDDALKVAPGNDYSLETKAKLLRTLDRLNEIEPLVEYAVEHYEVGSWAWKYAGFFRLKAHEYASSAQAFAQALRKDPKDAYARRKFIETCGLAGSDCPALFPEARATYPSISCDQAGAEFAVLHPNLAEILFEDAGKLTLSKPVERQGRTADLLLQFVYTTAIFSFAQNATPEKASRLLVEARVFECVSGGIFHFPDGGAVSAEKLRDEAERLYNPELRRNLIDLAHVYLNGSYKSP